MLHKQITNFNLMKNSIILLVISLFMTVLSSCAVIGGIFKAGFAVGIIVVILVIILLIWLISLFRGKN